MSFNPDSSRQAQEFISGRKFNKDSHPPLTFNNNIDHQGASHKHLVIILDNRLSFEEQLTLVFTIINETIGLIRKFQCLIPRSALLTMHKTFFTPHLDFGDVIYEKTYNSSFHQKTGSVQYNPCLTITGKRRGT